MKHWFKRNDYYVTSQLNTIYLKNSKKANNPVYYDIEISEEISKSQKSNKTDTPIGL